MLSGWVLHLVQVADGAVCFVFVLLQEGKVSTEKLGQGLVFVWVCYGLFCVFQGCRHLKCCLVVCLPSVRLLVWCECFTGFELSCEGVMVIIVL